MADRREIREDKPLPASANAEQGMVWLDTLELYTVHTDYGSEQRNAVQRCLPSPDEEHQFTRGISSSGSGAIAIELTAPAERLQAVVFALGSCGFEAEVMGDGRPLWVSDGKIMPGDAPVHIDADLFGVSRLELRMRDGGSDCTAIWADAKLLMDTNGSRETGMCWLSELQPAVVRPGYAHYFKDRTPDKSVLTIGDTAYRKGICMRGNHDLIYTFPRGAYDRFETCFGMEGATVSGVAKIRIYVDGVKACLAAETCEGGPPLQLSVPLTGARELRLVTECDRPELLTVWGSPLLVAADSAADRADAAAEAAHYRIAAAGLRVDLTESGEIAGIRCGEASVLQATGLVSMAGCRSEVTAVVAPDEGRGGVTFERRMTDSVTGASCLLTESFMPDHGAVRWDLRIRGEGAPWSTAIESILQWPVDSETSRFWTAWGDADMLAQGWRDPLESRPFRDLTLYYGSHYFRGDEPRYGYSPFHPDVFAIPIATALESAQGFGCSVILSPRDLTLDMSIRTSEQGEMAFSRINHRICSDHEICFTAHLIAHEANWRGGVSWMVAAYPEFFHPGLARVHELSGCGAYSMHEGDLDADKLKVMGFSVNWKASLDFPYMGMFLPPVSEETLWSRFNEDGSYSLDGHPDRRRAAYEKTSIRKMADYAQRMRDDGFHVLSYFNVTEFGQKITGPQDVVLQAQDPAIWQSANDYLFVHLADGALYWPRGFPDRQGLIETWGWAVAMDPGGDRYQRFLLDQAQRHIDCIPAADGICIDRLDWLRFYNDRADDGLSWMEGGPVRSLLVSWHQLMDKLGPLMHAQNKAIYCNNHIRRVDLLKHIDGIFGEFEYSGVAANLAAYCGFGKPVIGWVSDETNLLPDPDAFLQRFLHLGIHPMVPYPLNNHAINPGAQWAEMQYLDYGPLFNAIKGRTWVLTPGAVEIAGDTASLNVFAVDDSWLVVLTGAREQEARIALQKPKPAWETEAATIEALYPGDRHWHPLYTGACKAGMDICVPLRRRCALVRIRQ